MNKRVFARAIVIVGIVGFLLSQLFYDELVVGYKSAMVVVATVLGVLCLSITALLRYLARREVTKEAAYQAWLRNVPSASRREGEN